MPDSMTEAQFKKWLDENKTAIDRMTTSQLQLVLTSVLHSFRAKLGQTRGRITPLIMELINELGQIGI